MSRKLPYPISEEDFDKIIEETKRMLEKQWKPRLKEYTVKGQRIREYMIAICLGFGSGMRISEIFGLTKKQKYTRINKDGVKVTKTVISNIPALTADRVEDNRIRVINAKRNRDRIVPCPTKLFQRAGITKKVFKGELPLESSYRSMQEFITSIGAKVLGKHVTFHMLRHGFITHLLNSNTPIQDVRAYSGHSNLENLTIYAHSNPKEALKRYEDVFK